MDKTEMTEIMKKLQEPFDPLEIEWRVGSTNADKTKGLALAYVTNRAIMNRLDDVFGCFGWKNEFREWRGNSQLCGISIRCGDEWLTKWDGADDSNMEATKGGLSDAMKRAAYQWGIGRYLYNLPDIWMPTEVKGKTVVIKGIPTLPKWALPAGFVQQAKPAITGDKPAIETISKAQIMELTKECMTIDGKPDMKQIERLKAIYNRYGYHDAKDIQSKDFDKIKREFIESCLPFDLEGEQE